MLIEEKILDIKKIKLEEIKDTNSEFKNIYTSLVGKIKEILKKSGINATESLKTYYNRTEDKYSMIYIEFKDIDNSNNYCAFMCKPIYNNGEIELELQNSPFENKLLLNLFSLIESEVFDYFNEIETNLKYNDKEDSYIEFSTSLKKEEKNISKNYQDDKFNPLKKFKNILFKK